MQPLQLENIQKYDLNEVQTIKSFSLIFTYILISFLSLTLIYLQVGNKSSFHNI